MATTYATPPAVLNIARLNYFRLNHLPAALAPGRKTRVLMWIGGQLATYRHDSMTIHDVLNDTPNTCSFEVFAPTPPKAGQRVRVTIDADARVLLFSGSIQTDTVTFLGQAKHDVYPCTAIDDTWRANRRLPFGIWTNVSASTVAADIVAQYAPGLTATHIQPDLPLVSVNFEGTEGVNGALRQLARIIGGYFYWEDNNLHFFRVESTDLPDPVGFGTFLHDPPIQRTSDDSQIRTRILGKGAGTVTTADVMLGETILPVADVIHFAPEGGFAVLGIEPSAPTTQRIQYGGVADPLGGGVVVGPGVVPSVAPVPAQTLGTGLGAGTYQYAYTWATGSGETPPSPVAAITTAATVANPVGTPVVHNMVTGNPFAPHITSSNPFPIGQLQSYAYNYSTKTSYSDVSEMTLLSPNTVSITTVSNQDPLNPTQAANVQITVPCSPDARVKTIWIWMYTVAGGSVWRIAGTIDNVVGTSTRSYRNATLATTGTQPVANTTPVGAAMIVSGIVVGPTGTTTRKLYRTVANGTQLKLQQTISNNTATTSAVDTTPDGSLGANAPLTDTSGIVVTAGQVNAGSTTIPTSGTIAFPTGGGWVRAGGEQWIRYAGISGNTLTGIPAFGYGSILLTLPYGSLLKPAAAITGVLGLSRDIAAGSSVHIFIARDDWAAQAELAARESTPEAPSDGIYEYLISDERRGLASLTVLCDADLLLYARPIVTVNYTTHDIKSKSGKQVSVNVTDPAIAETLTIQEVTISAIDIAPGLPPRFAVTASSVRFSLENMLARLTKRLNGSLA